MDFKRLFTREEAERALPLVRQIVADILETARKIRELGENGDDVPQLQEELEQHMIELEEIGCCYKDWSYSTGLVDFPSVVNGETVFLCWRSDEESLSWYHPIEEGYRGRRPLPNNPGAV
ncbi:MAG TPA: DUF2203 domain-containing protein [Spirochaetia bacterium]|nr:DUF2203 domain-containing protein [Spirochaetia bacterium]